MSHQESLEIVRNLVTVVARTFYDDRYVLALDFLNRHERARDDVLGKYMHVHSREVHKVCGKLREDKLLRSDKRAEPREPGQQPVPRTYYHLDYKLFVDVVKWRMWKLQTLVKEKMEAEQQKLGYECPACNSHYSTMEALSLVDMATGMFLCENCSSPLEDNKDSEFSLESQRELSRFMEQCQPIINLLKKTDSIILPAPTPFDQVPVPDMSGNGENGADGKGPNGGGRELNVARNTGINTGDILIGFAPDLTPKETARIREAELERKRRQNALPAWHIWSTVSGVQMVTSERIPSESKLFHEKYTERRELLKRRWDKRARQRVRLVDRELVEVKQAVEAGQREGKEEREEKDESKREGYYSKYYGDVARCVGIQLPHDPREDYQHLLDQLAEVEEHERQEKEKRRLEQEKQEKEKQEAAAAAAAAGNTQHPYRRFRSRNSHFDRHKRDATGSAAWKMKKRLFAFIDGEKTGGATVPAGSDKPEPADNGESDSEKQVEENGKQGVPTDATDTSLLSQETLVDSADDVDPYLEGIYALPMLKRQKLGLLDPAALETTDSTLESIVVEDPDHVPSIEIFVGGQPKPIVHITVDDEARMSVEEYTEYWHTWHKVQQQTVV